MIISVAIRGAQGGSSLDLSRDSYKTDEKVISGGGSEGDYG